MIRIEFATDNAAFVDNGTAEVVSILRKIAEDVTDGFVSGPIRDSNGNTVGSWTWESSHE